MVTSSSSSRAPLSKASCTPGELSRRSFKLLEMRASSRSGAWPCSTTPMIGWSAKLCSWMIGGSASGGKRAGQVGLGADVIQRLLLGGVGLELQGHDGGVLARQRVHVLDA